jgi:hypothetical protein
MHTERSAQEQEPIICVKRSALVGYRMVALGVVAIIVARIDWKLSLPCSVWSWRTAIHFSLGDGAAIEHLTQPRDLGMDTSIPICLGLMDQSKAWQFPANDAHHHDTCWFVTIDVDGASRKTSNQLLRHSIRAILMERQDWEGEGLARGRAKGKCAR